MTAPAFVGVGSNADPEHKLRFAHARCRERFGDLRASPVYRSAARQGGADYLNAVFGFRTPRGPAQVRDMLRDIESAAGRTRDGHVCELDLDLLLLGDQVVTTHAWQLPHPDILGRADVLRPLADLLPDGVHPATGETFAALWERLGGTLTAVCPLVAHPVTMDAATPATAER